MIGIRLHVHYGLESSFFNLKLLLHSTLFQTLQVRFILPHVLGTGLGIEADGLAQLFGRLTGSSQVSSRSSLICLKH